MGEAEDSSVFARRSLEAGVSSSAWISRLSRRIQSEFPTNAFPASGEEEQPPLRFSGEGFVSDIPGAVGLHSQRRMERNNTGRSNAILRESAPASASASRPPTPFLFFSYGGPASMLLERGTQMVALPRDDSGILCSGEEAPKICVSSDDDSDENVSHTSARGPCRSSRRRTLSLRQGTEASPAGASPSQPTSSVEDSLESHSRNEPAITRQTDAGLNAIWGASATTDRCSAEDAWDVPLLLRCTDSQGAGSLLCEVEEEARAEREEEEPSTRREAASEARENCTNSASSLDGHEEDLAEEKATTGFVEGAKLALYFVDRIVGVRRCVDGSLRFKVRWSGYTPADDTWEPVHHLAGHEALLEDAKSNLGVDGFTAWGPIPRGKKAERVTETSTTKSATCLQASDESAKEGHSLEPPPRVLQRVYRYRSRIGRGEFRVSWRGSAAGVQEWISEGDLTQLPPQSLPQEVLLQAVAAKSQWKSRKSLQSWMRSSWWGTV